MSRKAKQTEVNPRWRDEYWGILQNLRLVELQDLLTLNERMAASFSDPFRQDRHDMIAAAMVHRQRQMPMPAPVYEAEYA